MSAPPGAVVPALARRPRSVLRERPEPELVERPDAIGRGGLRSQDERDLRASLVAPPRPDELPGEGQPEGGVAAILHGSLEGPDAFVGHAR